MVRSKQADTDTDTVTAEVIDEGFVSIGQPRPTEFSQVEPYVPPSETQHRRLLTSDELMEWVARAASGATGFSETDVRELFARAAGAADIDQLLSDQETLKGRTIPGVILRVERIGFRRGTFEDGCPYYTLMDVVRTDNDTPDKLSLGGWVVAAQAGQLHYLTTVLPEGSPFLLPVGDPMAKPRLEFPLYVRIKQRPTAAGGKVNSLEHPLLGGR